MSFGQTFTLVVGLKASRRLRHLPRLRVYIVILHTVYLAFFFMIVYYSIFVYTRICLFLNVITKIIIYNYRIHIWYSHT